MGATMFDSVGPEVLDRQACLALLGSIGLGRIVYTERAMPAIQPVPFVLHGQAIVLRASSSGMLSAAARDSVVAFEAGSFSQDLREGWSVRVIGRATEISAVEELAEIEALPLLGWAPSPEDHYLRIAVDLISGRRIPAE
jgi:nitroimidazol reductase NimA-like FMN-containing flavoprotein (pyridoxamine 5'-phosphate oxidase superfamily)